MAETTQIDWITIARQQWGELRVMGNAPFAVLDYVAMTCTLYSTPLEASIHGHPIELKPPTQRRKFRRIFDVQD
jgi:hypothetical protein